MYYYKESTGNERILTRCRQKVKMRSRYTVICVKPCCVILFLPHSYNGKTCQCNWRAEFWRQFAGKLFSDNGRLSCPVRLMSVLYDFKYASNMGNKAVLMDGLKIFTDSILLRGFILMNIRPISRRYHADAKNLPATAISHWICNRTWKSERQMDHNQLYGSLKDERNVIFTAAMFNIRKQMQVFAMFLCRIFKLALIQSAYQLNQYYYTNRFAQRRTRERKNLWKKVLSFSHLFLT